MEITSKDYLSLYPVSGNQRFWFGGSVNDRVCRKIDRNEAMERKIISDSAQFWEDYVAAGVEPELTESEAETRTAAAVRSAMTVKPEVPEEIPDKETENIINELISLRDKKKNLDMESKKIQKMFDSKAAAVITALGSYRGKTFKMTDKTVTCTFESRRSTSSWDTERLQSEHPEIYREFYTRKPAKESLDFKVAG